MWGGDKVFISTYPIVYQKPVSEPAARGRATNTTTAVASSTALPLSLRRDSAVMDDRIHSPRDTPADDTAQQTLQDEQNSSIRDIARNIMRPVAVAGQNDSNAGAFTLTK
jgi:hypothetical protein